MRVFIVNTNEKKGGAARAAYRLHQGLRKIDVESYIRAQFKAGDDPHTIAPSSNLAKVWAILKLGLDNLPVKFYRNRRQAAYSAQWVPGGLCQDVRAWNPKVVNLHWICGGYVNIETISRLERPVVWSLHDMWPFTGGCHYDQGCGRYAQSCGACPHLHSQRERDLSRWIWWRKRRAWKNIDLTIVGLSQWLAECARKSSLFKDRRIKVIPNGLDVDCFKPANKRMARERLNLPQDKQLVLFGAMRALRDSRKGVSLLQAALQNLGQTDWKERVELVVFGASAPEQSIAFGFPVHYLGTLRDDVSLSLIYSAADVFVAPSRQENLSNAVMEAMACGTPCVAFNVGGMPDMIDHRQNGFLAEAFEVDDLAYGITWILKDEERHRLLSHQARQKVEREFSQERQARRYLALYEELLARR